MLSQRRFRKFNLYTIIAVYLLIMVGGLVRSLGAGMGCPDWPKCFGSYIPPTNVAQLPDDYESYFLNIRLEKNQRFADVLESMGWGELAERVRTDQQIAKVHAFDPVKAWIEYVNRLVGVAIGIFVFLNMIFSFSYKDVSWKLPAVGVFLFLLTGFQGWVGSLVVSTNLLPGFITFHMFLALLMVVLLIWMRITTEDGRYETSVWTKRIAGILQSDDPRSIPGEDAFLVGE